MKAWMKGAIVGRVFGSAISSPTFSNIKGGVKI